MIEEYTEEELQQMFEDLRFFFPEDRIIRELELFHILDIFDGDQLSIKDSYSKFKREQ